MNFEIRPVITESGVKYRAVKPGGLFTVDKLICRNLGSYEFSLGDPSQRFSFKAEHLFDAPQEAASKIKEMFGRSATISRYRL